MSKKPQLPAPTESGIGEPSELAPTDLATDLSRRSDKTSYSIPEDGSPLVLPTKKLRIGKHGNSEASLLIEYFEIPGEPATQPSVRVKVITNTNKEHSNPGDRKPSYTRRVALTGSQHDIRSVADSQSQPRGSARNTQASSELSANGTFRHSFIQPTSDISSMPADSMIEPAASLQDSEHKPSLGPEQVNPSEPSHTDLDKLKAPSHRRSRSLSKERITQKVLEKLAREHSPEEGQQIRKVRKRRPTSSSVDIAADEIKPRSRKSSRSNRDDEYGSVTESSLLHARDRESSVSGLSKSSLNPKLLQTIEDVVRKLILPEIETIKRQQSVREGRPHRDSSGTESSIARTNVDRQLSQSTSVPYMKPKVVLTRDGEDTGLTLTGDSVRHRRHRRATKESSASKSRARAGSIDSIAEEKERRRRDKEDATAVLVGGALTAAALKSHDSHSTLDSPERERRDQRKRRSKSHTQATSIVKAGVDELEQQKKHQRLPMDSDVIDSELTRESILSAETAETGNTGSSQHENKGTQSTYPGETSHDFPSSNEARALRGASQTPQGAEKDRIERQSSRHRQDLSSMRSSSSLSSKPHKAALMAAGFGAGSAALYGHDKKPPVEQRPASRGVPRSLESKLESTHSQASRDTPPLAADDKLVGRNKGSHGAKDHVRGGVVPDSPQPAAESYQTSSLLPRDAHPSQDEHISSPPYAGLGTEHEIRGVSTNAAVVTTPQPVESHVASLLDPSNISSQSGPSGRDSVNTNDEFALPETDGKVAGLHESTSAERWAALRGHAQQQRSVDMTGSREIDTIHPIQAANNPRHGHYFRTKTPESTARHMLGEASYHAMEQSPGDRSTSILEGPLGDEHENRGQWPYEPTPPAQHTSSPLRTNSDLDESYSTGTGMALAGDATGLGIGGTTTVQELSQSRQAADRPSQLFRAELPLQNAGHSSQRDIGFDESNRDLTPTRLHDNKHVSTPMARSLTAESPLSFSKSPPRLFDDRELQRRDQRSRQGGTKHTRYLSGDSYGMNSPIYDSATGRGIDNIQSRDVMALMDHLTVRDGHRNARDTEILVTLVRSAAEMRSSFEDMKKFVEAQNQINLQRGDAAAERSVSKILSTTNRVPHSFSPQAMRSSTATDESPSKKRNIFQRALRGLGSKNTTDLSRMEEMLMQLLDEVDALRVSQESNMAAARRQPIPDSDPDSSSFDGLKVGPGQRTESLATPTSKDQNASVRAPQLRSDFYTSRDQAINSNEDDIYDDLGDNDQGDGMRTPTNEAKHQQFNLDSSPRAIDLAQQSPNSELYPVTKYAAARHRSTGSSLLGIPKISRWSKTTTSSIPLTPSYRDQRNSEQSRWDSEILDDIDERYSPADEDRLPSTESMTEEEKQMERSDSPLLPDSELSLEEAKYRANRHSLTLQHPQPRQGPNQNQRSLMETHARAYGGASPDAQPMSPTSDAFGSVPSLGRFNRFSASQDYRPSTLSPMSSGQLSVERQRKTEDPLLPNRIAGSASYTRVQYAQEEAYSSDAHSEDFDDGDGQWIEPVPLPRKQSPYSPGGLLAPIEERYSLEQTRSSISATPAQDRHSVVGDRSETPQQAPRAAMGGPESPTARKITGPRDMPTRQRVTSRE